jgi:hypothetical protein
LHFLDRLWKNAKIKNLIKMLPVGVVLFYAEGQTYMKKLIVHFLEFSEEGLTADK